MKERWVEVLPPSVCIDSPSQKVYKMKFIERFKTGDFVRHYKRNLDSSGLKYLYFYIGTARHTETEELLAVYKSLQNGTFHARPFDMFNEVMDNGSPRFEKATYEDLKAIEKAFS